VSDPWEDPELLPDLDERELDDDDDEAWGELDDDDATDDDE